MRSLLPPGEHGAAGDVGEGESGVPVLVLGSKPVPVILDC